MLYISRKKENKIGVINSKNGVENFYTEKDLNKMNKIILKHEDM